MNDTFLTLAPRSPWLAAALLVVPVALVLWRAWLEARLVQGWQAAGLLGLRLAALLVLWLVLVLRPSYVHTHVDEPPGRVLVAVDLSGSMDVRDPQRSLAEKIQLARALRLPRPGPELHDKVLDAWLQHLEATPGPALPWVLPQELKDAPAGRDDLARRRQALFEEWIAGVDRLSRKDVALALLSAEGLDLPGKLRQRFEVDLVGFDKQARPSTDVHGADLFAARAVPAATDLGVGLTDTRRAGRAPLVGVVLLTDGQHNAGPSPIEKAAALRAPIYPIAIGAQRPPTDIVVLDVDAPAKAFKGMRVPVKARIRLTHLPAQDVSVELEVDGKLREPEHRITIKHAGSDRIHAVEFPLTLDAAGPRALKVRARGQAAQGTATHGNERSRIVLVGEEPARVLLVDGEARWEHHYLATTLGRDPQVQLERVLFVQPRLGLIKEDQLDKLDHPRRRLPTLSAEREPLLDFDCIVLGDVAPEDLPVEQQRRLEDYVSRRGGTLVVCAGKRYMPLAYAKAPAAAQDPLVKLLPIADPGPLQPPAGFVWRLSAAGRQTSFLQLAPDDPAGTWPRLPKHYWGIAGKRRPGATVLAVADGADADRSDDPHSGIVIEQRYGAGRVIFIGVDSTWRWRAESGDLHHHRFWGQLVLAAAAEKILPAGNRHVRYGTRRPAYSEGEPVDIVLRLSDDMPMPPAGAQARLLRRDGDTTHVEAVVPLSATPANPRILEGRVPALPVGDYDMALELPSLVDKLDEAAAGQRTLFRVSALSSQETADVSTNWNLLRALAQQSRGRLLAAADAEQASARLSARHERQERRTEMRIWQDSPAVWWLLGLLLTLLTLEWSWRKWLELA